MRLYKKIFLGIVISSIALYTYLFSMTPSLSRDWQDDQKVLTKIEFTDDSILLRDIRNFIYESTSKYTPAYYDGVYNIADVESVYYIIEPFWNIDGFAHTMLSFGLIDGRYITISAEIRKQVGESFHPLKGLFNAYEILSKHPEFYNTLTNNCTTNILDHVNELKRENNNSLLRWWRNILLPEYSDEIAYELWLINTPLSFLCSSEYFFCNRSDLFKIFFIMWNFFSIVFHVSSWHRSWVYYTYRHLSSYKITPERNSKCSKCTLWCWIS